MNKGFILDGIPKTTTSAKNIFLQPLENYTVPESGEEEPTAENPFPGFQRINQIAP